MVDFRWTAWIRKSKSKQSPKRLQSSNFKRQISWIKRRYLRLFISFLQFQENAQDDANGNLIHCIEWNGISRKLMAWGRCRNDLNSNAVEWNQRKWEATAITHNCVAKLIFSCRSDFVGIIIQTQRGHVTQFSIQCRARWDGRAEPVRHAKTFSFFLEVIFFPSRWPGWGPCQQYIYLFGLIPHIMRLIIFKYYTYIIWKIFQPFNIKIHSTI